VQGIKVSAESISLAAAEVAQGNVDLSQRTEEQAASLEETAASMEQLTSTVRQNTERTRAPGQHAGGARPRRRASGGTVVKQVVGTMERIASAREGRRHHRHRRHRVPDQYPGAQRGRRSGARGRAGRGFAVVAGEVRTLAQRSAARPRRSRS
jgi:methyl-accepting chemotaxis protein